MRVKRIMACIGIIVLEGIVLCWLVAGKPKTAPENEQRNASVMPSVGGGAGGEKKDSRKDSDGIVFDRKSPKLVLVNKKNELDPGYDASLRYICNGRLQASRRLYRMLVQMLKDARKEGYHYWIASAYRSREKQKKLIEVDVRKEMQRGFSYKKALRLTLSETMLPGHSEHETGLALDILCSGNMNMDSSQEEEPGNVWLRENCHRYGFILRYPKDKEEITGIHYEPWHFRYVGEKASRYMKKHELTLEEFWERCDVTE